MTAELRQMAGILCVSGGNECAGLPSPVRLEPFSEADFDRLIAWSPSADFLLQWAGPTFTFPLDRDQLDKYLATARQVPPVCHAFKALGADEQVIGHVEIGNLDPRNCSARLSRVLIGPPDLRGRGLGRQVVRAALKLAFETLKLHRVDLLVFDFNTAAIMCYEREGFQHEGTLREARKHGDDYRNVCVMSILEQEWLRRCDANAPAIVDSVRNRKNA
jgi:RimJ/RimL family protein N-acetyltransferase